MSSSLRKLLLSAGCALALGTVTAAQAGVVIFDGGGPNQQDGNEATGWVQADDFELGSAATLTDVHFWTLEAGTWDGTLQYYLFTDNGGQPVASPFATGNGQNVVKTATGNMPFGLTEYSWDFDLQTPVSLLANTRYWLGLHPAANFNSVGIYWETTSPGFGYTGEESLGGTFNNWSDNGRQHAFYLTGPETSVPEPATLGLCSIGLLGLAALRRRRR